MIIERIEIKSFGQLTDIFFLNGLCLFKEIGEQTLVNFL